MIFFGIVVLPVLSLLGLVIGMISAYRQDAEQVLTQIKSEEKHQHKNDILYVSSFCVFVLLSLSILYFSLPPPEPVEHSGEELIMVISVLTILTLAFMGFMILIGIFIGFIMSTGLRGFVRGVLIFLTFILFLFSMLVLLGWTSRNRPFAGRGPKVCLINTVLLAKGISASIKINPNGETPAIQQTWDGC